jgi:hypothetical protein
LKNVEEDGRVRQAIIAANNHYAGFGPGTANLFRDMLGLSEVKWKQEEMEQQEDQRNKGPTQDLKSTPKSSADLERVQTELLSLLSYLILKSGRLTTLKHGI